MKKNKNMNLKVIQYDLVDKMKKQNLERLKMNFDATKSNRFFRNFKGDSKRVSHKNDSSSIQNNTTNYSSKLMLHNSKDTSQKQSHKMSSQRDLSKGRKSLKRQFQFSCKNNIPQLELQAFDKFEQKFKEFKQEQLNSQKNNIIDVPQQRFIQCLNEQIMSTKNQNKNQPEINQEFQTKTKHQNNIQYQNVQDLQYKLHKNKNKQFEKKKKIYQQRSLKLESELNDQCSEIIFESNNDNLTYEDFQNIDKMKRQMSVYWFELKQIVDLSSNDKNKLMNSKLNQIYQIQQKIIKVLIKGDHNNHSNDSKLFYSLLKQKIGYFYEILKLPKPKQIIMSQEKILNYFEQIYHKVQQNQVKYSQDSINQHDINNLCSGQSRASFNQQLDLLMRENNEKDEKIMFLIQQNQQIEMQFMNQKNENNQILSQLLELQRNKNNEINQTKEVDYLNHQLRKMKKKLKDNNYEQQQQLKQKSQKIVDLEQENEQLKDQLQCLYIQNQKIQSLNEMQKNMNNEQIVSRLSLSQISVDQSFITDKNQSIENYQIQQKIREQNQRFLYSQLQSQNSNMLKSQSQNKQQYSQYQTKSNNQIQNNDQQRQEQIQHIMNQFQELKKLNEDLEFENQSLKKIIHENPNLNEEQQSYDVVDDQDHHLRISFQKQAENSNGKKMFQSIQQQNNINENTKNLQTNESHDSLKNLRQSHRFNIPQNPFEENIFEQESGSEVIEEIEVVETESQYIDPEPISRIEEEDGISYNSNYQSEQEQKQDYNSVLSDTAQQLIQNFSINKILIIIKTNQFFKAKSLKNAIFLSYFCIYNYRQKKLQMNYLFITNILMLLKALYSIQFKLYL